METIKQTAVQALTFLEASSSVELKKNESQVSFYGRGKVTSNGLALGVVKLKRAFPKLSDGWYSILEEMLDTEGFTDKRFNDAVNNLIKTCSYPEPTIANILNYDKLTKLWTYDELLEYSNNFSNEGRKKFWDGFELFDKDRKLWKAI